MPLSPQVSPMSAEVVQWGVVESPELDAAVVCSDMSTIRSRFSPLNSLVSPVSLESVDRVVVDAPPVTNLVVPLVSRESQESDGYLSTTCILCFVTWLTDCGFSAGRGGCVARQHLWESGYVAVYHRPCRKLATLDSAVDSAPGYHTYTS